MDINMNDWERELAGRPPVRNGFTSELERKVRERIRMKQEKKKSSFRAVAAALAVAILLGGGWLFREDVKAMLQPERDDALASVLNDPLADKEITLKVQLMPYGDFDQIKKPFIIRHPSVTLDTLGVYATPETAQQPDKFMAFIEKEKPDVMMLPLNLYLKLSAEGKLKPLDALIKQSGFDLDAMYKPLVDLLRSGGSGELYGLAPEFDSTTLLVNKQLFEKYDIPIPEEGATLDDILDTAARFRGTGVYGLVSPDREYMSELATFIGQSSGLQMLSMDDNTVKATIESDGWKRVWQRVAEGYKDGTIGMSPPLDWSKGSILMKDIFKTDLFATGKAAMRIADSNYYSSLLANERETKKPFEWAAVPFKFDPAATNQYEYLNVKYVYAINAETTNADAAWELLKFIAGKEMAAKNDQTSLGVPKLFARTSSIKTVPEEKWKGFFGMEADPARVRGEYNQMDDPRYWAAVGQFRKLAGERMKAVVEGQQSVDQALQELQTELEASFVQLGKKEASK
jgi:multiple sugar transport system substrate-binding protein